MKVLEHSENRLTIRSNPSVYWTDAASMYNTYKDKGFLRAFAGLFFGTFFLATFVTFMGFIFGPKYSSFESVFSEFTRIFLIFYSLSVFSCIVASISRGSLFVFDKHDKKLTVYRSKTSILYPFSPKMTYDLDEIISVRSETHNGTSMGGPSRWREIVLVLQSQKKLKLYPGHEQKETQQEITTLIRTFLGLCHESKIESLH